MVLSHIFEFHANAMSLVGNFSGPCIIFLNGEAITVKQGNGIEIAKWPYNCIRQFKAEDETGKFSFVSGRRGPYGVAEYNFGLEDVSQLQNALSQFTGAQFSQAPSSSQPPLPPLPPIPHGQRPPIVSSMTRYGMGGRTDSIDSVFSSPSHTRVHATPPHTGPRLPPRDYLHSSGSNMSLSDSLNSSGGYSFSRSRNSISASDILDSGSPSSSSSPPQSHRSCVPQPTVDGGSKVSSNQHYYHQKVLSERQPAVKPKADIGGLGRARKSSPASQRRSPLTKSTSTEEQDEVPDLPPRDQLSRPKTTSTGSMAPPISSSTANKQLKKQHTEPSISHKPSVPPKPTVSPKPARLLTKQPALASQSPSPEHGKDEDKASFEDGSTTITPEPQLATSGTSSPVPDATDLDQIPRSSPTVSRGLRTLLKGRRSPQGKMPKSITLPSLSTETYDVPKSLQTQLSAEDDGRGLYNNVTILGEVAESEGTYHVPRPTIDSEYHVPRPHDDVLNENRYYHHPKPVEDVYKVPRPMSGTYSSLLGHTPDNIYSSPKPLVGTRSPQGVYYSYPPDSNEATDSATPTTSATANNGQEGRPLPSQVISDETSGQLYSNVSLTAPNEPASGDLAENFYTVPRPGVEQQEGVAVATPSDDDGLYKVPRSLTGAQEVQNSSPPQQNDDGLYKVPRSLSGEIAASKYDDDLYKIPRSVKQSGSESPPPRNPYEQIDLDQQRIVIRPARSLESLHRVKTLPPRTGNRYIDSNVASAEPGWIRTQPLPPRPQPMLDSSTDDNVYAEIPEDLLSKRRMANARWSPPARGERTFDNLYVTGPDVTSEPTSHGNKSVSPYDKLPPRRPSPEVVASEGVAKAKELAKQGYELCLPSGEDPKLATRTPTMSTPPRNIPRKNFSSLEKYDVTIPGDLGLHSHRTVSASGGPMTPGPSDSLLGSSIPTDSSLISPDEYVIITRSDTRLKYSQTAPILSNAGRWSGTNEVPLPEGDEYEQMNSVKSQILLSQSIHYSTPNPSLYHNGDSGTNSTTQTAAEGTEVGGANHLYGNVEHTDKDFSNLDRVARPGEPQLVRSQTLPPRRYTVSTSSADSDVFSSSLSGSGPASIPEDQKKLVRVTSGGQEDATGSPKIRLRSCSNDHILENGSEKPKRHSYVNVTEDGELNKPSSAESASQLGPPKKPKPAPRSSLLRMESEEQK